MGSGDRRRRSCRRRRPRGGAGRLVLESLPQRADLRQPPDQVARSPGRQVRGRGIGQRAERGEVRHGRGACGTDAGSGELRRSRRSTSPTAEKRTASGRRPSRRSPGSPRRCGLSRGGRRSVRVARRIERRKLGGSCRGRRAAHGRQPAVRGRGPAGRQDRAPRRDLPARFGNGNSVWRRADRWARAGRREALSGLLGEPDLEELQLDSAAAKTHPCASGSRRRAGEKCDADARRDPGRSRGASVRSSTPP